MTPLEIRIIAYGLIVLSLIGGGFGYGLKTGEHHVQAAWDIDKAARTEALATAQAAIIVAQNQRDALQSQLSIKDEQIKTSNAALVDNVSSSVRNLETSLRSGALFSAMAATSGFKGTGAGSAGDIELKRAVDSVNAAIGIATSACLHDSRELTLIQAAAPVVPQP